MIRTKKNNPIILSLAILFIQILYLAFLLFAPTISYAAEDGDNTIFFKPQVPIGDYGISEETIGPKSIGLYIEAIYKYAIGIVGIVAAAVIMWSGFSWIMAGGNPQKITEAKSWLTGALGGLVLAMTCFLILNTINPALIKITDIQPVKLAKAGNCCDSDGPFSPGFNQVNKKLVARPCPDGTDIPSGKVCAKINGTWKAVDKSVATLSECKKITGSSQIDEAEKLACEQRATKEAKKENALGCCLTGNVRLNIYTDCNAPVINNNCDQFIKGATNCEETYTGSELWKCT